MKPRLDIRFPIKRQWHYWFGTAYEAQEGEYLLNHARTGIVMALRASVTEGCRVGVVAYNCHTVANAVVNAGCRPVFVDVTEELKIDLDSVPDDLDAIVVTNLFGIRNDVAAIRERCPKAVVIVDNAHGYGLPAEGDFTVYSINQGKFPALGEGGILKVAPSVVDWKLEIEKLYARLPIYSQWAQIKLFFSMLMKAVAYSRCFYWWTLKAKGKREMGSERIKEKVAMRKMAPGVRRLYNAALPEIPEQIERQRVNALKIGDWKLEIEDLIVGENAFMAVAKCEDPEMLKQEFAAKGIETETHFKHCIDWAKEFGYVEGSCPNAEALTKHLLMIPTYTKI